MEKYTIILKNGRRLEGLSMNGTMFVSESEITWDMLDESDLKTVTIQEMPEDGEARESVLYDAICDTILHWPEGWLFNLREPSQQEKREKAMTERITFLEECLMEMSEEVYK